MNIFERISIIFYLIRYRTSSEWFERADAIKKIGSYVCPLSLKIITQALNDNHENVRIVSARSLINFNDIPKDIILNLFKNKNQIIKNISLALMGKSDNKEFKRILISSLSNKQLCYTAVITLMSIDNIILNYDYNYNYLSSLLLEEHAYHDCDNYKKYTIDDPGALYFLVALAKNEYYARDSINKIRHILDSHISKITINQLNALNSIRKVVQIEVYFTEFFVGRELRLVPVDYHDILIKVKNELKTRKDII